MSKKRQSRSQIKPESTETKATGARRSRKNRRGRRVRSPRDSATSILKFTAVRRLLRHQQRSPWILLGGFALIILWQFVFYQQAAKLDRDYTARAASGVRGDSEFLYFYHYLGIYPLATERAGAELEYSREGPSEKFASIPISFSLSTYMRRDSANSAKCSPFCQAYGLMVGMRLPHPGLLMSLFSSLVFFWYLPDSGRPDFR